MKHLKSGPQDLLPYSRKRCSFQKLDLYMLQCGVQRSPSESRKLRWCRWCRGKISHFRYLQQSVKEVPTVTRQESMAINLHSINNASGEGHPLWLTGLLGEGRIYQWRRRWYPCTTCQTEPLIDAFFLKPEPFHNQLGDGDNKQILRIYISMSFHKKWFFIIIFLNHKTPGWISLDTHTHTPLISGVVSHTPSQNLAEVCLREFSSSTPYTNLG